MNTVKTKNIKPSWSTVYVVTHPQSFSFLWWWTWFCVSSLPVPVKLNHCVPF